LNIKGTTSIYGIFGHPVVHSLSPLMHNSAFRSLGLDCVYVAFDVAPENLKSAAIAIRSMNIKGINVTIPHKQRIMDFLDQVSSDAEITGAVNTVKNEDGKLTGYNTDVGGFLRAIKEDLDFNPRGKAALIFGAGGAARAVLTAFCTNQIQKITVVNRTAEKARGLVSEFQGTFNNIDINACSMSDVKGFEDTIAEVDIVVNSTSLGMEGKGKIDIPFQRIDKSAVVYDLVYKPHETGLIKDSKKAGLSAAGGIGMLLYQGAESFEIWTEMKAPVNEMKKVLL